MNDNWTADLWRNYHRFTDAREKLRTFAHNREAALRAIQEDGALSEPERETQLKHTKASFAAQFDRLKTTARDAQTRHQELVRGMRAARRVDAGAQGRVRTLLERGLPAATIIERALQQGEPEVVAALRAEMPWWGDRNGFHDTDDVISACDRALAKIGHADEVQHNEAVVEFAKAAKGLPEILEFGAKAVGDQATPTDRLRMAYAAADADRDA